MLPELISQTKAAKSFGLTSTKLADLLASRSGPMPVRIGRQYFYPKRVLEDWAKTLDAPRPAALPMGANAGDVLLTSVQVRGMVGGVSDMCIWRWIRDERVLFPKPMKMNKRNYWRQEDIKQWLANR